MKVKMLMLTLLVLVLPARSPGQSTQIRGFTDVVFTTGEPPAAAAFELGQFDLFMTSQVSDRISFLSETVFEYDEGFIVDVERVIVKFEWAHYLSVSAGKHHTPIGYWNTAYHHGSLLQPTIQRPLLFRFEDEGGILPIHTVGLLLQGDYILSPQFGYSLMIGNGIGSTPVRDNNAVKSMTVSAHLRPARGLLVGASLYRDRLAAGTLNLREEPLPAALNQTLLTGTVVYQGHPFELMTEYVRSVNAGSAERTTTWGYYLYAGYRVHRFVPYVRLDRIDYATGDPYYVGEDTRGFLLGLRYDAHYLTVLKGEVQRKGVGDEGSHVVVQFQVAVGF